MNTPDYKVGAVIRNADPAKRTKGNLNLGAAWKNKDGTISVILDEFVVIPQQPGRPVLITLFPFNNQQSNPAMKSPPAGDYKSVDELPMSDDTPF